MQAGVNEEKMVKRGLDGFEWIDLWFVPSIPTNATFASVGLPLASEASAVAFVVVVVRRSVKPVPKRRSGFRFYSWFVILEEVSRKYGK